MKTLIEITPTIEWKNGKVRLIDQTKLPLEEKYIETDDYRVVCDAIYRLAIRGAPAIGVAGAYACVLAANEIEVTELSDFINRYLQKADEIGFTRPTAVKSNVGGKADEGSSNRLFWKCGRSENRFIEFSPRNKR